MGFLEPHTPNTPTLLQVNTRQSFLHVIIARNLPIRQSDNLYGVIQWSGTIKIRTGPHPGTVAKKHYNSSKFNYKYGDRWSSHLPNTTSKKRHWREIPTVRLNSRGLRLTVEIRELRQDRIDVVDVNLVNAILMRSGSLTRTLSRDSKHSLLLLQLAKISSIKREKL